jgi:hypothetical protein
MKQIFGIISLITEENNDSTNNISLSFIVISWPILQLSYRPTPDKEFYNYKNKGLRIIK